ncbi:MAG: CHAT domain-containing protein [Saprospiraceae bacterium]
MKHLLFTIFTLVTVTVFGQPTGNIEEDTAKANRLYEEAITYEFRKCNPHQLELLEEALNLYKAHPFVPKSLLIKSALALRMVCDDEIAGKEYSLKVMEEAKSKLNTDEHPYLGYAYVAYLKVLNYYEPEKAFESIPKAKKSINKNEEVYFYFIDEIYNSHNALRRKQEFQVYVNEIETVLKSSTNVLFDKYWVTLNYFKADYYSIIQDYESSILYYSECLRLNEKYDVFNIATVADLLIQLGMIYAELNNLTQMNLHIKKALNIIETNNNIGTMSKCFMYSNIGYAFSVINDTENAILYEKEGIKLLEEENNDHKYNQDLILSYTNLAISYLDIEDFNNAEIAIKKSFEYGYNPNYIDKYADLLIRIGKYDKALEEIQKALSELVIDFTPKNTYDNPFPNAKVYSDMEVHSLLRFKSQALYKKAMKNKQQMKNELLENASQTGTLSLVFLERMNPKDKGDISLYIQNQYYYIPLMNQMEQVHTELYLMKQSEESFNKAFEFTERKKSAILNKTITPLDLPQDILNEKIKLSRMIETYNLKVALSSNDSLEYYQQKLLKATKTYNYFIESQSITHQKAINNTYDINIVNVSTLQNTLNNNDIFISYTIPEIKTLDIYLITKDETNIIKVDIDDEFFNDIKNCSKLLKNPLLIQSSNRNKLIEINHRLYLKLMTPIEKYIDNNSQLLFSPSDLFFDIPFEILLATNEQKPFNELDFLIKKYDISYQYSATIYSQLKNKPAIKDNSLFAFAPVFNEGSVGSTRAIDFLIDSLYRGVENNRFLSLPNTKTEVETIAKTLEGKGQTTILLEENATKTNYNQATKKQSYQFVHIATHGLVNFQNPRLSALACYSKTDKPEDNLLFANEIQMQDIKADLVVLSSCESGIGQFVSGEGLIALNRSFIYSGANNVMFSLWKVSDKYSAELMIDFYKSYLETNDYSAALRQAKLKMLKDPTAANPRYWAAFVLIGK